MLNFDAMFEEHAAVVAAFRKKGGAELARVTEVASACIARGGKILICGNGGSAADAQHFAAECVVRFEKNRLPVAAISLTTDTSILTAVSNDVGFELVFARQVSALGRPGDVLFAISTSGKSPNIVAAAARAKSIGCHVVAFTGSDPGPLGEHSDDVIAVPSTCVARIQEVHEICLHAIAAGLENSVAES